MSSRRARDLGRDRHEPQALDERLDLAPRRRRPGAAGAPGRGRPSRACDEERALEVEPERLGAVGRARRDPAADPVGERVERRQRRVTAGRQERGHAVPEQARGPSRRAPPRRPSRRGRPSRGRGRRRSPGRDTGLVGAPAVGPLDRARPRRSSRPRSRAGRRRPGRRGRAGRRARTARLIGRRPSGRRRSAASTSNGDIERVAVGRVARLGRLDPPAVVVDDHPALDEQRVAASGCRAAARPRPSRRPRRPCPSRAAARCRPGRAPRGASRARGRRPGPLGAAAPTGARSISSGDRLVVGAAASGAARRPARRGGMPRAAASAAVDGRIDPGEQPRARDAAAAGHLAG